MHWTCAICAMQTIGERRGAEGVCTFKLNNMISRIRDWAVKCHKDTNHLYDDYLPYEFHLRMVVDVAYRYMHLGAANKEYTIEKASKGISFADPTPSIIICACWCHDLIEDARINYNSMLEYSKKAVMSSYVPIGFGDIGERSRAIADIVYAVSNEKGKNRAERESDKYFEGIRNTEHATFVKLCDRIANIEYSKMTERESGGKLEMYRKEYPRFYQQLCDEKYRQMFDYIEDILIAK